LAYPEGRPKSTSARQLRDFVSVEILAALKAQGEVIPVSGDEIEIVMQDEDGFAKGVAHRVSQTGAPKVSTH
jgi:2-phospho-L-lactate transferase/gluconeogenesis factor (CofD/UPF0052 family)